jgi:hypothetical protein
METQIKKVGEDIKIVITIDANELANLIGTMQTELFIENKSIPESTIGNPFYGLHHKTIAFIRNVVQKFGTEIWISPKDGFFQNLRWMHRVDDVAQIFRNLETRGAMVIEYNDNKTRITRFKLKKNVQWT